MKNQLQIFSGRKSYDKKIGHIFLESMSGNTFVVFAFTSVGNRDGNSKNHISV